MYINIKVAIIINWEEVSDWYWSAVRWEGNMEVMGIHWNQVWNICSILIFIFKITFVLIFALIYNLVYMKLILKSCSATASSFFSMLKVDWVFDIFPSLHKNWRSVFLVWWIALVSSKDFLKPSDFLEHIYIFIIFC